MKPLPSVLLVTTCALTLLACGEDSSDGTGEASGTTTVSASTGGGGSATDGDVRTGSAPETTALPPTTAPPTTAAADPATALPGRTYVSTVVEGFTLVEGTAITLTFEGTNLGANAGCNQLASSWSLEGDVLVVAPMVQTMMACDPPTKMDQDTWLTSVLTSRPTLTLAGDTLTLAAPGATVTFTDQEVVMPDLPLEGTAWTVDTLVTADAASSLPAAARPPSMTFDAGTVSLDTGCNRGNGSYTVASDAITFGPIATTRMACLDEGSAEMEQHVLAVLTGTATFTIDAGVLTLTNGDLGLVARG